MFRFGREEKEAIVSFCWARSKREGGFSATPHLPPTIEDTFYALKILQKLNSTLPKKKTLRFLAQEAQRTLDPRLAYLIRECFLSCGKDFQPRVMIPKRPDLEQAFYLHLLGIRAPFPRLSKRPTVKEIYYWGHLDQTGAESFLPYVRASQNPDGGFGFYPGSTSFLENSYYAFFFLKLFGEDPKDLSGLEIYVLSCFRHRGFARSPKGIPFLESTYQALEILFAL